MGAYAENNCFNLGKLPYGSLVSSASASSSKSKKTKGKNTKASKTKADTGCYDEGVMFATYSTLIGKNRIGTRLEQLVECEYSECFEIHKHPMTASSHTIVTFIVTFQGAEVAIQKNLMD